MRVAAGVKAELARRDLSTADLADHLEVSVRTLRRWLKGEGAGFNVDVIDEMADFFNIPPVHLVTVSAIKVGDLHIQARDIYVHRT